MLNKCLEPLTAIVCALGAGAGLIDAGITGGALIGEAALIARFREQAEKHGLDSADLIRRMQRAMIREWDRADQTQEERDAIGLADTAMALHLSDCLPTREALAATALRGEDVYPAEAARLVVDRLAEHDAMFAATGAVESIARRFALTAVARALRIAKDDPDYAPLLTLDLVIEVAGGVGRIERGQETDRARDAAFQEQSVRNDAEQTDLLRQILSAVARDGPAQSVTDEALIELARRIADKVEDAGQALDELRRAIDAFIRLRDAAARGSNLGDLVDTALREIAAANERRAFDEAARVGEHAFSAWREGQEAARLAGLRLIEVNIEQQRLRFDADAMAHWVCEGLTIERNGTLDFAALREKQDRWYETGLKRGLRLELDVSVALARRSIAIAASPDQWANGQNDLAISLSTQGELTGGDAGLALLGDAVAAYRAALTVYTEAAMPADWAMTQNNLGNALQMQGERTSGDAGLALLCDAVTAYRAALTVSTEAAMPAYWAGTQNNLGNVLQTQGERTGGEAGLALLGDAVAAYSAALTVRTEAAMPAYWAITQNNLGTALQTQGGRTGGDAGLALLTDAVAAYRAALTVRTEGAMPADWAMTQNNLGNALQTQGERTGGDAGLALLGDAVAAYRAALTVSTEAAMPAYWAGTQNNLGNVLKTQGERTGGEAGLALLADAVAAYCAALTVCTAAHFPYYHDVAHRNLAAAQDLVDRWPR